MSRKESIIDDEYELQSALKLDEEAQKMRIKYNLLPYVTMLNSEIYKIYKNITSIKHRLIENMDVPGEMRLRFEIHLTGEPEQILQDERNLHTFLFAQVPEEIQHLFSFTYRIS